MPTSTPNPPGTVNVDEHEARLTAAADALEARGLALLGNENRIVVASANQCLLSAIKARAAAAQLALARAQREHSRWLMERHLRLRGEAPGRSRQLRRKDPA